MTISNEKAEVDDINVVKENQRQGFWTWGSKIYIDNIKISKLGMPAKRTYLDVARDFLDVVGVKTAVRYLMKEIPKQKTHEDRVKGYKTLVKFCLNASIREKNILAPDVVNMYPDIFLYQVPSDLIYGDLQIGFFGMCYEVSKKPGNLDPDLERMLEKDKHYREFRDRTRRNELAETQKK